jgi:hypothetical protein
MKISFVFGIAPDYIDGWIGFYYNRKSKRLYLMVPILGGIAIDFEACP